jgi:methyl-accepting chemotaxis protein
MNFIRRSILAKQLLVSGAGTVLVLLATCYGFWLSWATIDIFQNEVEADKVAERSILGMQLDFKKQVQSWKDVLLRGTEPNSLEKYWKEFENLEQAVQQQSEALEAGLSAGEARDTVAGFRKAHLEMGARYREGLAAYRNSKFDFKAGDKAVKGMDRAPTELLTKAAAITSARATRSAKQAAERGYFAVRLSLAIIAVVLAIVFFLFVRLVRSALVIPARHAAEDMATLAAGDFSVPVRHTTDDELGSITAGAEKIRVSLGAMMGGINASSAIVSASASSLAAVATQVNSCSMQQSESSAATAATVEEFAVSIESIANSAEGVRQMADASQTCSRDSTRKLTGLMDEMRGVQACVNEIAVSVSEFIRSTQSISSMTRQVKDISDQTNLLALNAAIEAARAGEQGRGFAVVADEVRVLAGKAAAISGDIQSVTGSLAERTAAVEKSIGSGLAALKSGQEVAQLVAKSIAETDAAVAQATSGIDEIANAVMEQKTAMHEIAKHIETMAQMAEENSSAIGGARDAAGELETMAAQLQAAVAQFKV